MTKVKYTGTSDFQIFDKKDFQKAGVEDQSKVKFARGKATEVSEAAATALTSTDDDAIFGQHLFEAVESGEGENPDNNPEGENKSLDDPDGSPDEPPANVDTPDTPPAKKTARTSTR